jgi:hypothetical protein
MLCHALNAAISIDSGAPQAHELLVANSSKGNRGIQGVRTLLR